MSNPYFSNARLGTNQSEHILYNNATNEVVEMIGRDFLYLPKTHVQPDHIFGEDIFSQFNSKFTITLLIENYDEYSGSGDLFAKFGLSIDDRLTLSVQQDKFNSVIGSVPKIGDIIQYPITKQLFKVNYVQLDQTFNQFVDTNMTYKMECVLYQYSHEDLNTGDTDIDDIENEIDSNTQDEINEFTARASEVLIPEPDPF